MKQPLQVIHIEDSRADQELVGTLLSNGGIDCSIQWVTNRDEFVAALEAMPVDLILSDCSLPQFHGVEALEIARATRPDVPFIFVSGTIGEEAAVDSLQHGATDYVLKGGLSRLVPAVRRAVAEAESRASRLALEAQLRQARKLETIGTLLGGIAHDFRNVLQILKLNLDLLPLVAEEPDQVRHIADQMERTIDRGSNMMKEILVFARKTDAHIELIDLAARLNEVKDYFLTSLPANVELRLQLTDGVPPILADPSQFDRMISNLIGNAIDAMPSGGEILIGLDLACFDSVHAQSWHAGDSAYVRVRVADNGLGMDEALQARIFEPFFTTKPPGKGTGLGLSVVFGLMESHQGFIDLDSQPGKGTTFSLFFPVPAGVNVSPDTVEIVTPTRLLGRVDTHEVDTVEPDAAAEI
jgi:signal transduction histidine kinase